MSQRKTIGDYEILTHIGEGGFAHVVSAIHKPTNIRVAIKIVKKIIPDDVMHPIRIRRELEILKKVKHPFICEFLELLETETDWYFVMELVQNGTLLEYVNSGGKLSEKEAGSYFAQMLSVVNYLHKECSIAHRDLKAENVLLDRNKHIRIIDFGLSNTVENDAKIMQTACGSPAYAAPEMIKGEHYTMSTDIWSLGILLYAIVASHLPFDDPNMHRLMQKIVFQQVQYPAHFSRNLCDLLDKMLAKDPNSRITIDEIIAHPWMQGTNAQLAQFNQNCINVPEDQIFNDLSSFGYNIDEVKVDLAANKTTRNTVAYNLIKREKTTDMLTIFVGNLLATPNSFRFPTLQKPIRLATTNFSEKKKTTILLTNANTVINQRRRSVLAQSIHLAMPKPVKKTTHPKSMTPVK